MGTEIHFENDELPTPSPYILCQNTWDRLLLSQHELERTHSFG